MRRYVNLLFLLLFIPVWGCASSVSQIPLQKAHINLRDKASLQRGAKIYINYCLGCHSLTFLRYNRMAKDIGITGSDGKVNEQLVKENLIFTGAKVSDTILSAMPEIDAKQWFGVAPPDLTLIVKIRGADWLTTYLHSFYVDSKRPFGVNNLVFPDVAMPDVLANLHGTMRPSYRDKTEIINGKKVTVKVIDHLVLEKAGTMSPAQYDLAVNDLVNFLSYVAAPEKLQRESIGVWVILFLVIFAVIAYFLKREYWKDIQ